MFENENNEELLLNFLKWLTENDVEHTGTDIWRIDGNWINDKQLIEEYLSDQ